MIRHPCPIPQEKLAKNRADYAKLYSFGENIIGEERYNRIYSSNNGRTELTWFNTQKRALDNIEQYGDIPVYSHEFSKGGARKFTVASCGTMADYVRNTKERFIYWFINEHKPVNFFVDFDMSYGDMTEESRKTRCLNLAIEEFIECVDLALIEQRDVIKNPDFQFSLDYTISRLDGNRQSKESTHLIFHFPGPRMFENYSHCGSFFANIIDISNKRHSHSGNPLFFQQQKSGEYQCIADIQVYSKNRNWRTIASYKNKERREDIAGALYPPCDYRIRTGDLLCSDKDCKFHAYQTFSDSEWCENDPTFIPRLHSGKAMTPILLRVEAKDISEFKYSGGKKQTSSPMTLNGTLSQSAFFFRNNQDNSNMSMVAGNNNTQLPDSPMVENTNQLSPHSLVATVAKIISIVTKSSVTFTKMGKDNFAFFRCNELKACCYKYKREIDRSYVYNGEGMLKTEDHKFNHVSFSVKLDHPKPVVYRHCTDDQCQKFISDIKDGLVPTFKLQKLDISGAPGNLLEVYRTESLESIRETEISSDIFLVKK